MSDFPLDEQITFWVPTYVDGQATYPAVGILADAATASKSEEVITGSGKDPDVSKLAVYTDAVVEVDFLLAVGDFSGLTVDTDAQGAKRVLAVSVVPSGTITRRVLI